MQSAFRQSIATQHHLRSAKTQSTIIKSTSTQEEPVAETPVEPIVEPQPEPIVEEIRPVEDLS